MLWYHSFQSAREPMSSYTHFLGVLLSLIGLPLSVLLYFVKGSGDPLHLLAALIFCCSTLALYTTSCVYHFSQGTPAHINHLRKLDHAMIYVLIAGSYTPMLMSFYPQKEALVFSLILWIVAAVGIGVKVFWLFAPDGMSTAIYLLMGWSILFDLGPPHPEFPPAHRPAGCRRRELHHRRRDLRPLKSRISSGPSASMSCSTALCCWVPCCTTWWWLSTSVKRFLILLSVSDSKTAGPVWWRPAVSYSDNAFRSLIRRLREYADQSIQKSPANSDSGRSSAQRPKLRQSTNCPLARRHMPRCRPPAGIPDGAAVRQTPGSDSRRRLRCGAVPPGRIRSPVPTGLLRCHTPAARRRSPDCIPVPPARPSDP